MVKRAILTLTCLAGLLPFWVLFLMGHPRPGEPRFIYQLRRHPSAIPEYIALLAYGLFQPPLLQTGATHQESIERLPGDGLVPQRPTHPAF